jgi:hypothetical protein
VLRAEALENFAPVSKSVETHASSPPFENAERELTSPSVLLYYPLGFCSKQTDGVELAGALG